jgi:SSS family solute:Na+ symporter
MSFTLPDLLLMAAYFAAVLLIGFRSGRRSARPDVAEYLLAGRSLTVPLFVMTLVSTWYGGILGVGEFSYLYGISNWFIQGVPYYVFAVIFAFALARRVRATGLATIPDRLAAVYDRRTALLGAFLTFLLTTPAPYILMLAVLLQVVSGWSLALCLIAGTLATTVYLVTGGFRSDVNTDVLEFFLMFLGFAVLLPFAAVKYGGLEALQRSLPPLHLTLHGGNSVQFIIVWFFIALWTLIDPAFHQRCYAAQSGRVARNGILWSVVFWFIFDGMTAIAGLYARAAMPNLDQPVLAFPLLAEATLPAVAKGLFMIGLLATIMSTLNTLVFVSATTLGRDILSRIRPARSPADELRRIRIGLAVTGTLSIAVALAIPSVIKMWYTIGTVLVPGLLIPLVTSYFSRLRIGPKYAFWSMLLGWLTSLGWLLAGWTQRLGASELYPLGVEPMYPGLAVSVVVWGIGRKAKSPA